MAGGRARTRIRDELAHGCDRRTSASGSRGPDQAAAHQRTTRPCQEPDCVGFVAGVDVDTEWGARAMARIVRQLCRGAGDARFGAVPRSDALAVVSGNLPAHVDVRERSGREGDVLQLGEGISYRSGYYGPRYGVPRRCHRGRRSAERDRSILGRGAGRLSEMVGSCHVISLERHAGGSQGHYHAAAERPGPVGPRDSRRRLRSSAAPHRI